MSNSIQFYYQQEIWCLSALVNRSECNVQTKIQDLLTYIRNVVASVRAEDLKKIDWNPSLKQQVLELTQNLKIEAEWIPLFTNFPFKDENTDEKFDTIGYIQFEVEYFPENDERKKEITSSCLQQIPTILQSKLQTWDEKIENLNIKIDTDSPIYIFAISNRASELVEWDTTVIQNFKKILGSWIEIYSGQWPDYSEALYQKRIQNNLSNRLSELHFIRNNSGFIFMNPENYDRFFNSYMRSNVIKPTFQVRTIQFTLLQINQSLDKLYQDMQNLGQWVPLDELSNKIDNLKHLRGVIQTKLTTIYDELDYNRRQHYTAVLTHLLNVFRISETLARVNQKFELIDDSLTTLYRKKANQAQELQENRMNQLSILFGLEILIGLTEFVLSIRSAFFDKDYFAAWLQLGIALGIFSLGAFTAKKIFTNPLKNQHTLPSEGKTVDAVIIHEDKIVLIKRKNPPFKNNWALPGGFIEKNEKPKDAVIREVKEETSLEITPTHKIGYYDTPGRDPRGPVASTAFLCKISETNPIIKGNSDALIASLIPIEELEKFELAFDHAKIIKDAFSILR